MGQKYLTANPRNLNPYLAFYANPTRYIDIDGRLPSDKLTSDATFTSPFNEAGRTLMGLTRPHLGIDTTGKDLNVMAAARGNVWYKGNDPNGWGNFVILEHYFKGKHLVTIYSHFQEPSNLKIGQSVQEGDILGLMGKTGRATGTHLHFEIREIVDPTNFKTWKPIDPGNPEDGFLNIGEFDSLLDLTVDKWERGGAIP